MIGWFIRQWGIYIGKQYSISIRVRGTYTGQQKREYEVILICKFKWLFKKSQAGDFQLIL